MAFEKQKWEVEHEEKRCAQELERERLELEKKRLEVRGPSEMVDRTTE